MESYITITNIRARAMLYIFSIVYAKCGAEKPCLYVHYFHIQGVINANDFRESGNCSLNFEKFPIFSSLFLTV